MPFAPITDEEAQHLTRGQLLHRIAETQAWLDRGPRTKAKRLAGPVCGKLLFTHLKPGTLITEGIEYLRTGERSRFGYLDERIDGSPPRWPTRVTLSRQQKMPFGCRNVSRPGRYGNPFTVAEYGDEAVPRFADLLAHPDRYPQISYPTIEQIREELRGWDLACWCAVPEGYISPAGSARLLHLALAAAMHQDDLCHGDILLRVAAGGMP